LVAIVQAHRDYYDNQLLAAGARTLAQACRSATQDCLASWDEEWKNQMQAMNGEEGKDEDDDDASNLELLKLTLAVLHLSDIFLPLLHPQHHVLMASSPNENDDPMRQQFTGFSSPGASSILDAFQKPGAVTAPLVRFLRYHFDSPHLSHPETPNMLQAQQPECYAVEGYGEDEESSLYWVYVKTLVLRGCLTQAWEALSRHSMFQSANSILVSNESGDTLRENSQQVVDCFLALKQILNCAPLPGGRDDEYDDAIFLDRAMLAEQDENNNDMDYDGEEAMEFIGLRVTPEDYKIWEPEPANHGHDVGAAGVDFPLVYNDELAKRKHTEWKQYLQEQIRPDLQPLLNRIPQLNSIFDILSGSAQLSTIAASVGSSWAESFCATLLYQSPHLQPSKMPNMADHFMKSALNDQDGDGGNAFNDIMLNIMQGKASEAIEALYTLGGATGAALPSTLLAVIYTLYLDAKILAPEAGFRQTEFLCDAATSIVASIAKSGTESADTATALALGLLLPHCMENEQIRLCVVHTVERYNPLSDSGAREVMELISTLLMETGKTSKKRKKSSLCHNLPLFEAYDMVVLCRYRHYSEQSQPGTAVVWLATGMQFRAACGKGDDVRAMAESGTCYRTLCALCISLSTKLLHLLTRPKSKGSAEEFNRLYHNTRNMVLSIEDYISGAGRSVPDMGETAFLNQVAEVQVLLRVFELVEAHIIAMDNAQCASLIVACIQESKRVNSTVGSLIPLSLHWPLLVISYKMLEKEESVTSDTTLPPISAFDQAGISCLLESLLQVMNLSSKEKLVQVGTDSPSWGPSSEDELLEIQGFLARALARACVVENAKTKKGGFHPPSSSTARSPAAVDDSMSSIRSIRSMDVAKHTPHIQQAVVLNMLEL